MVHKTFQSQTPLFLSHQMGKFFVFGFPNFSIKIRKRVQENKIRESCTLLTIAKFINKKAILKRNRRGPIVVIKATVPSSHADLLMSFQLI